MGGKNKSSSSVPVQPTTKINMGQFGSGVSGPEEYTWNATPFQQQFTENAQNQMLNYQNLAGNPQLSEQRINDLNRTTNLNFQNNQIMPALQKGLLRGSTAQDIYSVGQKNYANAYQTALDQEEQRNMQRLANAIANYTIMYDIARGTTGLSQSANNAAASYALNRWGAENGVNQQNTANNNAMFGALGSALGQIGSTYVNNKMGGA